MAFTKINAAGIGTTETVTVDGLTVINNESIGGNLTVTGNATISGVLTYEDVTNVDSVGLITARNGVVVGSGITLSKDGDIFATGVTTSTTFSGNFSGGTVSGTTGTFSSDVKSTAGIVDIRSGSSINTNVTGASASGTLQKNTTSGEFAIVSGGTGGNNYLNFYTSASGAPTAKLRITHDGKIGITESSPAVFGVHSSQSSESVYYRADSGSVDSIFGSASSLGYSIAGTTSNHAFVFYANNAERARIDTTGRLLLNTTTEGNAGADDFTIGQISGSTGITIRSGTTNNGNLYFSDGTSGDDEYRGSIQYQHANNSLHIATNAVERLVIDTNGKILIGHNSHNSTIASGVGSQLQIEGTSYATSGISLINNQAATDPAFLTFGKSRAGSNGGTTVVQNGDRLGAIRFAGADGTDLHSYGAEIGCVVNGTPGSNDMPSQLFFATTADGSASPTTRLQIQADGKFFFGNDTSNQDSNRYVFVGTKAFSGGIVQGQLAIADNNAYNFSNNGGGIAFQAKYSSGGAYTQMAAIEGRKSNNTDGHYGGVLNFSTRTHNGNLTQAMYITADQAAYMREALYVGNEFNMQSFDAVARDKYFDAGYLNNALYIRRTNGGDGGHAVQMTIASSGVISGDFNDTSDAKLKKNVETIADGAIEDIKKLRPVTFDWIDDTRNNNISGFIAQEVKEVLPNLVEGTEYDPTLNDEEAGTKGGIKSEGYSIHSVGVTAHLTKAVQELIAEVETLKAKVAALEG